MAGEAQGAGGEGEEEENHLQGPRLCLPEELHRGRLDIEALRLAANDCQLHHPSRTSPWRHSRRHLAEPAGLGQVDSLPELEGNRRLEHHQQPVALTRAGRGWVSCDLMAG